MCNINDMVDVSTLDLAKSVICNNSRASTSKFYMYFLNLYKCGQATQHVNPITRTHKVSNKYDYKVSKICM